MVSCQMTESNKTSEVSVYYSMRHEGVKSSISSTRRIVSMGAATMF